MSERPDWLTNCEGFICTVCWSNFSDTIDAMKPRVAPQCGHSFCLDCFEGCRRGSQATPKTTSCPTCRRTTEILPVNFKINYSLLDVIKKMNEAEDEQRPAQINNGEGLVVPCFEDQNHEADLFCTSCKEGYCEPCFKKAHENARFMQKHKSVKIMDKPVAIPMCTKHSNTEAFFYCCTSNCSGYKNVGCEECKEMFHNHCSVEMLAVRIKFNSVEIRTCHEKLQEKKAVLNSHLDDLCESVASFESDAVKNHEQLIRKHFGKNRDETALKKYKTFVTDEKNALECQKEDIKLLIQQTDILEKKLMKKWIQKINLHEPELIHEAKKNLEKEIPSNKFFFKLEDYTFYPDMSRGPFRPV